MRKHWKEIDVLYTIGFLLVLIGHSHSSNWSKFNGTILERVILFIYTFHMPLFFFIAGFLFQNSDRINREGYRKWIKEKAFRLLTPYFFWSLLAAFPKYYIENKTFSGVMKSVGSVFINPRDSVWGHFWYLPVLFFTYAIFGVLNRYKKKSALWISFIVSAVIYFMPIRTQVFGLSDLRSSLIFFSAGMLFNSTAKVSGGEFFKKAMYSLGVTCICVILTVAGYHNTILGLSVSILMISVCWMLSTMIRDGSFVKWISSHNFTLYIFSWFFQAVMMQLCESKGWITTFFLMALIGLLGPAVLITIYERVHFLHKKPIKLILGVR